MGEERAGFADLAKDPIGQALGSFSDNGVPSHMQQLLDALEAIVLVLDPSGRIVLANRAAEKLTGLERAKIVGRTVPQLGVIPLPPCPDDATGETRFLAPSGEVRVVAWGSHALREPDGSLRYAVATGSDVTEARTKDARLRESERRFEELAENVNDLVAELDRDAVFTYVNPRFETALGAPRASFVGRSVFDCVHPGDRESLRQIIKRLQEPGAARRGVLRVRHADGTYRCVESVGRSFTAPDGNLRLAVISRDVSERAANEAELRRADRLVTLGTFAAGVAHEINNPVAAILLAAEVALERPRSRASDLQAARTLESIAAHARRCGSIVRSMLDFAAQGRSEHREHDVNELVARAGALVEGYARERGAQLRFAFAANLPPIAGNGVEIEQVFVNLLRNALESSQSALDVEVITSLLGDRVRVTVSDNGDGIPLEERARVFEPFFSTKRAVGGTGLGLAISRRIVADHGGDIRVEDRSLRGTCFAVELPSARAGPS